MNIKLDNHTIGANKERILAGRPMKTVPHVHAPFSDRNDGRGGIKNIGINFLVQLSRVVQRLLEGNSFAIRSVKRQGGSKTWQA